MRQVATTDLPVSPGHPFHARLNAIFDEVGSTGSLRMSGFRRDELIFPVPVVHSMNRRLVAG